MKKMPSGKQVTVEWLIKTGQVTRGREFSEHYDPTVNTRPRHQQRRAVYSAASTRRIKMGQQ